MSNFEDWLWEHMVVSLSSCLLMVFCFLFGFSAEFMMTCRSSGHLLLVSNLLTSKSEVPRTKTSDSLTHSTPSSRTTYSNLTILSLLCPQNYHILILLHSYLSPTGSLSQHQTFVISHHQLREKVYCILIVEPKFQKRYWKLRRYDDENAGCLLTKVQIQTSSRSTIADNGFNYRSTCPPGHSILCAGGLHGNHDGIHGAVAHSQAPNNRKEDPYSGRRAPFSMENKAPNTVVVQWFWQYSRGNITLRHGQGGRDRYGRLWLYPCGLAGGS